MPFGPSTGPGHFDEPRSKSTSPRTYSTVTGPVEFIAIARMTIRKGTKGPKDPLLPLGK